MSATSKESAAVQTEGYALPDTWVYPYGSPPALDEEQEESTRVGPWHQIDAKTQARIVERLTKPQPTHCSRHCASYPDDWNGYEEEPDTGRPRSTRSLQPRPDWTFEDQQLLTARMAQSARQPREGRRHPNTSARSYPDQLPDINGRCYPHKPWTPAGKVYGDRRVTSGELDTIVDRVTRPTVSSKGGVDLADKDFTYIHLKPRKTLLHIPGLERRYMGLQSVQRDEMKSIVSRLTRMTRAYSAKFGPNYNVWVDDSPRRH